MAEPRVDIEYDRRHVHDLRRLADPGHAADVDVYLRGRAQARPARSAAAPAATPTRSTLHRRPGQSETNAINTPTGSQANRRVFLSPMLKTDLHLSGTPVVDLQASLDKHADQPRRAARRLRRRATPGRARQRRHHQHQPDRHQQLLGRRRRASRQRVLHSRSPSPRSPSRTWRVTQGHPGLLQPRLAVHADARRRRVRSTSSSSRSCRRTTPFPAGHQIGVILLANYSIGRQPARRGTAVTLDTQGVARSSCRSTGGYRRAAASGGFVADTVAPVITAPATSRSTPTDPTGTDVTFTPPTATDTQDAAPTVTCDTPTGAKFGVGTTDGHLHGHRRQRQRVERRRSR